jgi:hypothetical protein
LRSTNHYRVHRPYPCIPGQASGSRPESCNVDLIRQANELISTSQSPLLTVGYQRSPYCHLSSSSNGCRRIFIVSVQIAASIVKTNKWWAGSLARVSGADAWVVLVHAFATTRYGTKDCHCVLLGKQDGVSSDPTGMIRTSEVWPLMQSLLH